MFTKKQVQEQFKGYNLHPNMEHEEACVKIAQVLNGEADLLKYESVCSFVRECFFTPDEEEQQLVALNELMDCFGVESIVDKQTQECVARYVNTGDTYAATVVWDMEEREFILTSWGDWFEAYQMNLPPRCSECDVDGCFSSLDADTQLCVECFVKDPSRMTSDERWTFMRQILEKDYATNGFKDLLEIAGIKDVVFGLLHWWTDAAGMTPEEWLAEQSEDSILAEPALFEVLEEEWNDVVADMWKDSLI